MELSGNNGTVIATCSLSMHCILNPHIEGRLLIASHKPDQDLCMSTTFSLVTSLHCPYIETKQETDIDRCEVTRVHLRQVTLVPS